MTACNIACERALVPFVIATKGERSKVASYSEQQQAQSRRRGQRGGGEGGKKEEEEEEERKQWLEMET